MIIHGSDVNLAALSEVKSLADLKKLEIFNHLPNEDEANKDLFKVLRPGKEVKEPELPVE
jgi:hypothetical protein